jgi:hypothetical protein
VNFNLDLSHAVFTVLSGGLLFLLRRELRRHDGVRGEVMKLIKACTDKLVDHEARLNRQEVAQARLDERVSILQPRAAR